MSANFVATLTRFIMGDTPSPPDERSPLMATHVAGPATQSAPPATAGEDYIEYCHLKEKTPVYLYIHLFWVSNIKLNEQTFDAFFYFRATWVPRDKQSHNKPPMMIMNAIGEPNIKNGTMGESTYRAYKLRGVSKKVLEWKGRIHGTFRYSFEPRDFPYDKQLLFVLWSLTEPGWVLVEDVYGMDNRPCRSEVRAELHAEPGFVLDGPTHQGTGNVQRLSIGFETVGWEANTGADIPRLKFWVLVSRTDKWYYYINVLLPCILVSASEFLIFAIPRSKSEQRIANTLSLVFLLLPSKFLVSSVFPRVGNPTVCEWTALAAFTFLLLSLFIVVLGAVIAKRSSTTLKIQYEEYSAGTMFFLFIVKVSYIGVSWYRCWRRNGKSVSDIHNRAIAESTQKATVSHLWPTPPQLEFPHFTPTGAP